MTATAATRKLEKWLEVLPKDHRPFKKLTVAGMTKLAQSRGLRVQSRQKNDLLELLSSLSPPLTAGGHPRQQGQLDTGENVSASSTSAAAPEALKPLINLIDWSFLRPQNSQQERQATRIGLRNEEPFLKAFWKCCIVATDDNPFADVKVATLYRPGLVCQKGSRFIKGLADGLLVEKVSWLIIVFVIAVFVLAT